MPKLAKLSGIKRLHSYTILEAAGVTGVSERTIRAWIKQGLAAMTDERPTLVRGDELITFIKSQRKARKSPLSPDEFYCLKCREARKPAGGLVDCETNGTRAKLTAICEICGTIMHRPIAHNCLSDVSNTYDVTMVCKPVHLVPADHKTNTQNRH